MDADHWAHEQNARKLGYRLIAGIDEAGRGPLAGPVVASAVVLPFDFNPSGIDDSKQLTPKKRASLYDEINCHAVAVGIGIVDEALIDEMNILRAALLAMGRAVADLTTQPDYLLIDGTFPIETNLPQMPLPKGDAISVSIAAASIIAKVTRDRIMDAYHDAFPRYGFSRHKGYPTRAHRDAIQEFGCCPIHRRSFKGVKEYL
ncbi:MAG: ribonuclease HII [Desulfobacterales bacterium]|jgi:ribonuclease HII|nr:ribonuclease HII [Desulfobacterales bacterium]